jgi:hypothetical protein
VHERGVLWKTPHSKAPTYALGTTMFPKYWLCSQFTIFHMFCKERMNYFSSLLHFIPSSLFAKCNSIAFCISKFQKLLSVEYLPVWWEGMMGTELGGTGRARWSPSPVGQTQSAKPSRPSRPHFPVTAAWDPRDEIPGSGAPGGQTSGSSLHNQSRAVKPMRWSLVGKANKGPRLQSLETWVDQTLGSTCYAALPRKARHHQPCMRGQQQIAPILSTLCSYIFGVCISTVWDPGSHYFALVLPSTQGQ